MLADVHIIGIKKDLKRLRDAVQEATGVKLLARELKEAKTTGGLILQGLSLDAALELDSILISFPARLGIVLEAEEEDDWDDVVVEDPDDAWSDYDHYYDDGAHGSMFGWGCMTNGQSFQTSIRLAGTLFFMGACSSLFVSAIEPSFFSVALMILNFILVYLCFTIKLEDLKINRKE
jgi:hypothetical protein